MATSPHPGVIQLDHPNVYMAAKEAQKENWLRRGLDITGDLIQKRNQDVRYRRAAGLDEDRSTAGELAEKGIGKVWEGAKTLGSGIASVGEGAWGLLKAPFTEDVVTEKSYEEGVKTERPLFQGEMSQEDPFSGGMSREKTMSLVEPEPSDAVAVSFPTTVVGKDRVVEPSRREVGGKFDWDFPNKGYKTEFPTTVVGAPSTLKAPSAQPVSQKAPEAPQNDAGAINDKVPDGMLRAPNWSEMYRLDQKRAEYDWGRERDLMADETRQKTAGRNVQAMKKANAEHDIPIRQEMEEKAISLFEDVRSGALDKNSSEYVSRRGELGLLNAKLYSPYNKTSFDKLLSEGVVDRSLELREEGMDIDREKEKQRILENTSKFAESAGKQIMAGYSDLLKKIETRGSMLESFRQGTLSAIASRSSATFAAALKSLIQSLDNSVVMQGEWGPFQNASYLDRAKAWLEKQSNNTTFSGEEMRQAWETAKAWAESTKTIVAQAQDTAVDQAVNYPGLRRQGINPKEVSRYVDAALEAYVPKSDFSKEPKWPAVLDMTSPTLQEGAGAVDDLLADPKADAGFPTDPMAVVPKKKKGQSAPAVPMATEDDLW